jgi:hypothetical protein
MEVTGRHAPAVLPLGKNPSHCKEAGWDSQHIWLPGFEPRNVQSVAWSLHQLCYLWLSSQNTRTLRHFPEDNDLFLPLFWMFPIFSGFFKFSSSFFRWYRKLRKCTLYSTFAKRLKLHYLKKEAETTFETYLADTEIWIVLKYSRWKKVIN